MASKQKQRVGEVQRAKGILYDINNGKYEDKKSRPEGRLLESSSHLSRCVKRRGKDYSLTYR